ncbi:MAG: AraC family transcriptional regulator [Chitinophagaceae bacterium]|nr:MAG: AraC family transcriptional regulator [Chitinophagaceae bacterium]
MEVRRAVDGFVLRYSLAAGQQPPDGKTRPDFGKEAAQLAVNYIEKYYTEPGCGRLKEFSRMFNVSEKMMRQEFFALTGRSLTNYVRNRRMEKAATLIEEGMASVNEVAEAVGYTAASNFTRDFGLHYHITPGSMVSRKRQAK